MRHETPLRFLVFLLLSLSLSLSAAEPTEKESAEDAEAAEEERKLRKADEKEGSPPPGELLQQFSENVFLFFIVFIPLWHTCNA